MKSTKRTRTGRKIPVHSKNDKRGTHLKKGSILKLDTKIVYRTSEGYKKAQVEKVLTNSAGVSFKKMKWITKGSVLKLKDIDEKVVVTSRTNDLLVGKVR